VVVRDAARSMLRASLLYLKEREPPIYRALVSSTMRYIRARLSGETVQFTVRHPTQTEGFWHGAHTVMVLSIHRELTRQLREACADLERAAPRRRRTRGTEHWRHGQRQEEGTQRFHALIRKKAEAIQRIAEEVFRPHQEQDPAFALSSQLAATLARARHSPSEISKRVLAEILGKRVASVRDLLVIGAKQDREGSAMRENLEANLRVRAGVKAQQSVKPSKS